MKINIKYILSHGWFTGIGLVKAGYLWLISSVCMPLSLLFVVGVLSQGRLLLYALAGGIISMMVANSIGGSGELAQFRLDNKHQDLIVTTITGPIEYMSGEMLGCLSWSVPGVLLYLALDMSYHLLNIYNLTMTLFVCVLVTVSTLSLIFCIYSLVKSIRKVWALGAIFSTLLVTVPPTFYPYTYIPKSLLYALAFLPTTPAVVLEQGLFNLAPMNWYMLAVLILETFTYLLLARYATRWRER